MINLIKIVDISIVPAVVMIFSKFISVYILLSLFSIPWSSNILTGSFFATSTQVNLNQIIEIISYSDLIMYLSVAIGFSIFIIRSIFLHRTHVHPTIIIKLGKLNLLDLVWTSYRIYHSAFVWLVFLVLANIIILVNTIGGLTHTWIFFTTFLSTIVLTSILLYDVQKEINAIQTSPKNFNWN